VLRCSILVGFHPVSETEGLHPTFKITGNSLMTKASIYVLLSIQKIDGRALMQKG
jgi:hypothetical protein